MERRLQVALVVRGMLVLVAMGVLEIVVQEMPVLARGAVAALAVVAATTAAAVVAAATEVPAAVVAEVHHILVDLRIPLQQMM